MKKSLALFMLAFIPCLGCNKDAGNNAEIQAKVVPDKGGVAKEKPQESVKKERAKAEPPTDEAKKTPKAIVAELPLFKGKPSSFWIKQLMDKDASFRTEAVRALAALATEDRAIGPNLISALKDSDKDVREAAEKGLGGIPLEEHVPILLTFLDKSSEGRVHAIRLLKAIGLKADMSLPLLRKIVEKEQGGQNLDWVHANDAMLHIQSLKRKDFDERCVAIWKLGGSVMPRHHAHPPEYSLIKTVGDYRQHDEFGEQLDPHAAYFIVMPPHAKNDDLKLIPNYESIYLCIKSKHVTDDGLKAIKGHTAITTLWINNTNVTDNGLLELRGLSELRTLGLANTQITDDGLKYLQDFKKLLDLDLSGTKVTDAGMKHLKSYRYLCLADTRVTDAGLRELKESKETIVLGLGNTGITDAGLRELDKFPNLTILNLRRTKVTDVGLREVGKLKSLSSLDLRGTQVTDAGVMGMANRQSLKRLEFSQPK